MKVSHLGNSGFRAHLDSMSRIAILVSEFLLKRSVDSHNGQIFVDSEVGIGTKFTVKLLLKNE